MALNVADLLSKEGKSVRVVSFPSFELFNQQSKEYQSLILDADIQKMVVIEAQTSFGWHQYAGRNAVMITVEEFGLSGTGQDVANHFGFSKEKIMNKILQKSKAVF